MVEWHAFVDESGLFDDADPAPVLGALLVRTGDPKSFHDLVRTRLEAALAQVAWPPNTTLLNLPVYHAFGAVAEGTASIEDELVVDTIRLTAGSAVDRVISLLRDRQRVRREWIAVYNDWLAQQGGEVAVALDVIEGRLRAADAAFRQVLHEIGHGHEALVTSSAETFDCEAALHPSGRYQVVLAALVERMHDVVARRGQDATLTVSCLELHVNVGELGRQPFDTALLEGVVEGVRASRLGTPVRVIGGDVRPFDRHVPGGFVLADFVANRLGRVLRHGKGPTLARAHDTLSLRLGVPIASGRPEGSHLAASGAARDAVAVLRRGGNPVWPAGCRPWAIAQASQWAVIK